MLLSYHASICHVFDGTCEEGGHGRGRGKGGGGGYRDEGDVNVVVDIAVLGFGVVVVPFRRRGGWRCISLVFFCVEEPRSI